MLATARPHHTPVAPSRWWEGCRACGLIRFRPACSDATAGRDMDFVVVLVRPVSGGSTLWFIILPAGRRRLPLSTAEG